MHHVWFQMIKLWPLCTCMYSGSLIGHPVENLRIALTDGAAHAVDSSELAFKLAAIYAFRQVLPLSCVYWWISLWMGCIWRLLVLIFSLLFFFFQNSIKQCYVAAKPVILEPVMLVELKVPTEFQGTVAGDINKWVTFFYHVLSLFLSLLFLELKLLVLSCDRRKGVIVGNDQDGDDSIITAHVSTAFSPLFF